MTSLQHPHIEPPLVIEVEDDAVPAHVAAGWLPLAEEETSTDPKPTGEDHKPSKETA